MAHKDTTGLAWSGSPAPRRSGGFVDGVGLNQAAPALAVDPNGVVGPGRPRRSAATGPQLTMTRMDAGPTEDRILPSGRFKTPR